MGGKLFVEAVIMYREVAVAHYKPKRIMIRQVK